MVVGDALRIIMILTGICLAVITIVSLARRKMTESFCLTWGIVSVIFILAGILLRPYGVSSFISVTGLCLITFVGVCVLTGGLYFSLKISELERKNQELAIQVTLLNHDNKEILDKLEKLLKEDQKN